MENWSLSNFTPFGESDTTVSDRTKKEAPPLFKVFMHNDDYTTMEFVVRALETVFRKSATDANRIMMHIHLKGVGMCGIYPFEIAETKAERVHTMAEREGFPLRCTVEEA